MICHTILHGIRNLSYNPAWYNTSVIQPLLLSLSIVVVVVVVVIYGSPLKSHFVADKVTMTMDNRRWKKCSERVMV